MDGASGYLREDVSAEELHDAIHTLHEGGSPVDPKLSAVIAGWLRLRSLGDKSPVAPLSAVEHEVLARIVRGETNRQIGDALHLDDKVVKHRVADILKKIKAKNRVAAAAWWARQPQVKADVIADLPARLTQ
jgi:DNA-binding NarL/FixJ family response regulator